MLPRRDFIATSISAAAFAFTQPAQAEETPTRKFTMDLRCSSIGVPVNQQQAIDLAARHGFESVGADSTFLADLSDTRRDELMGTMAGHGLKWGSAGLPVQFRNDQATFDDDLKLLAKRAAGVKKVGGTRMGTYIMPCHDDLTYLANFRLHADRLRQCAKVLADHGLRLGLEYVGPKTLWTSKRYSFLHSMAGMKDLLAEINVANMGFILDSWHWYTAGETVDDLKTLTNADIVACDLNDAPKGLKIDQQIDSKRELPMATGVIDVGSFLRTLIELGYDGPVRAEPFNQTLNQMDNDAAVSATATAMKKAIAVI